MAGVNSLGIGSGVLTSDLIDKLRAADDAAILKPFETKITLSNQKEEAYTLLSSLMTTFKSSTSALGSENLYLGREVSGNTDAVTVAAQAGSDIQSFNITNVSKAEKDVWNSQNSFADTTTAIPTLGSGTLTITIDGKDLTIEYTAATTIDDIKTAINDNAGDTMTASSLQIGDSSYSLAISADTLNQAITFSDSNVGVDGLATLLNLNNIQPSKAATFNYNGIAITRSTNDVSDLINGVTITLNQNQSITDSASINISQNNTSITSEISMFVENYNLLASNLSDMTSSDTTTGSVGVFNRESFVKSIAHTIKNLVTQVDSNGNSLMDFGIDIARDGTMSLDSSVFSTKFNEDPAAMELFFVGDSTTDGIFKKLNNQMDDYSGYNGQMNNFSDQLTTEKTSLTTQYDKQKAMLDARYEIMTKRFTAYDAMISKLNSQFTSLQMMIDAQSSSSSSGS